jgi:hypothetical protein
MPCLWSLLLRWKSQETPFFFHGKTRLRMRS